MRSVTEPTATVIPLRPEPAHDAPAQKPRLRSLRQAMGWERKRLARRLGVEPGNVRRWETGKEAIPDEHLMVLSDLFGVSVSHLLDRHDDPTDHERAMEDDAIAELREYLAERTIPRLPASCEWRWVAVRLERALAGEVA